MCKTKTTTGTNQTIMTDTCIDAFKNLNIANKNLCLFLKVQGVKTA
jgi:hypothetical protein